MATNTAAPMNVFLDSFAVGGKHQHRFATSGDRGARRRLTIRENSSSSATHQVEHETPNRPRMYAVNLLVAVSSASRSVPTKSGTENMDNISTYDKK